MRSLQALAASTTRVKGPELAAEVGSTAGFVSQVLTPLVRAGWVRSDPGPAGGYSLVADLDHVSVLDVIEAVEGPTDTGRCVLADRPCSAEGPCALHHAWQRARAQLLDQLDAIPVAAAGAAPSAGRPPRRDAVAALTPRSIP